MVLYGNCIVNNFVLEFFVIIKCFYLFYTYNEIGYLDYFFSMYIDYSN